MEHESPSDAELSRAALRGEQSAERELVGRYDDFVRFVAFSSGLRGADVDAVSRRAWRAFWRSLPEQPDLPTNELLFVAARYLAYDQLKARRDASPADLAAGRPRISFAEESNGGAAPTDSAASAAASDRAARSPGRPGRRYLPLGRVLSLIGGLALLAAYFMPWLGLSNPQGSLLLSGDFLGRFLGSTGDLRPFMPGTSGDPGEARALRALVYLFPASGALAALLAILGMLRPSLRRALNVALAVAGLMPLLAVLGGVSRLPSGASLQVGLWLIGAGSIGVLAGMGFDALGSSSAILKDGDSR